MPWDPLKQWFHQNGLFVKMRGNVRDKRVVTHLLLDGGKVHIPPDMEGEFLVRYAACLDHGNALYVVETKTPIYKFMSDLDFAAVDATTEEEIAKVLQIVHTTVAEHFPLLTDKQRRVVVCRTENKNISKQLPRDAERDGQKAAPTVALIKTGIHLIWPEILVDSVLALSLRGAVLFRLTRELGQRDGLNPWSDVVDRCVYGGNGLRMVGSRKMAVCTKCRNVPRKRNTCEVCNREGKKDEGRVYKPTQVLEGPGTNDEALEEYHDILKLVRHTSIRTDAASTATPTFPAWTVDMPAPDGAEDLYQTIGTDGRRQGQKRRRGAEKANKDRRTQGEEPTVQKTRNILEPLDPTDRRHKAVAAFVRKHFPDNPVVTHLHPTRSADYFLARSSSRFCMNKGGYHNNVNIYFYIDRNGIKQKCFCKCDVNRAFGPCSKYASDSRPYSAILRHLLWPEFKRNGVTLHGWNRHRQRTNMDEWLEDCIIANLDRIRGKSAYEEQFFKENWNQRDRST